MTHLCNGVFFNHKNARNLVICSSIDETGDHCVKLNEISQAQKDKCVKHDLTSDMVSKEADLIQ